MKIRISELRAAVRNAIREAAEDVPPVAVWQELPDASLDSEIDSFLVAAESGDNDLEEAFLHEAEPGEDIPAEDIKSAPDPIATEKDDPKIDVTGFAREVAHLVENVDNLIDVKGTILRRALNYVGEKYGKEQTGLVKDILETQYGLYYDNDAEEPTVAPAADRAGPAMAG
jgi:hypothetical protein